MTDLRLRLLARYIASADPSQSHDEFLARWNTIAGDLPICISDHLYGFG